MVIQRWQSVFLLLASIMMGIFCVLPLATQGNVDFYPYQQPVYLILNALVAVLSFIAIFLFLMKRINTIVCISVKYLKIVILNLYLV